MANASRDENNIPTLLGASSSDGKTPVRIYADPDTHRLLVQSLGGGVTSVSVVTANGVSGSVATATTTPAITLTLGTITPTSVRVGTVGGYISSDGSAGATGSFTTVDLKTVTVKDGIITSITA